MSNGMYIGVDGVARKVTGMYVGVDGVARKVAKAYIGVNGVAQLFYQGIPILEECDWATIQKFAADGTAANYWSVGDTKAVVLNGTVSELTFSNKTYYVYILGFNHNESIEGKGIHFGFGKTAASGGEDIAFCDKYSTGSTQSGFTMKTGGDNNNNYGWVDSKMYKSICPAFFNALPSDLQNVISECTKYTDNSYQSSGSTGAANDLSATSSQVWLLAEYEVFGKRSYANIYEQNYQQQYAYYANGNSAMKISSYTTSTAIVWYLRSKSVNSSTAYCAVGSNGAASTLQSKYSRGFVPCFKVG